MISYISARVQRQLSLNHFGQIQIMSHFQSQFATKLSRDLQTDQKEKKLLFSVFGLHFQKSQNQKVKKSLQQKVKKMLNKNQK